MEWLLAERPLAELQLLGLKLRQAKVNHSQSQHPGQRSQ